MRDSKMRRRGACPHWWEASYGGGMSDASPTAWSRFLAEMVARPGWSVARLHRESGVGRSTIFRWLKGEGGLTIHSVRRIAEALGVDPAAAMLAAGSTLGPPNVDEDPEMRAILDSRLSQPVKDQIIARVRARRAHDLEETKAFVEVLAGEPS